MPSEDAGEAGTPQSISKHTAHCLPESFQCLAGLLTIQIVNVLFQPA
jgi:hypothetical protein